MKILTKYCVVVLCVLGVWCPCHGDTAELKIKNLSFNKDKFGKSIVLGTIANNSKKSLYIRGKFKTKNPTLLAIHRLDIKSAIKFHSKYLKKNIEQEVVITGSYLPPSVVYELKAGSSMLVEIAFPLAVSEKYLEVGMWLRYYETQDEKNIATAKKILIYKGINKWRVNKSTKDGTE